MTTHFRTVLLLGFTALAASLSGCIIETTNSSEGNCAEYRYFQVYWAVDNGPNTAPLTCDQVPPSTVQLVTSAGTYAVGIQCSLVDYMGFRFDFKGSTNDGVPTGTYVTTANLISNATGAVLSSAPGAGANFPMPACDRMEVAYLFSLQ